MTDAWHRFIENVEVRRFAVLAVVIFALWMMRSMMNMILFTFILTYIVVNWVHLVRRWLPKLSPAVVVIITYTLLVLLLYFGITQYLPVLVRQIIKMVNSVLKFYSTNDATAFYHYVNHYISTGTIMTQLRHGLTALYAMLEEMQFPQELIVNATRENLVQELQLHSNPCAEEVGGIMI